MTPSTNLMYYHLLLQEKYSNKNAQDRQRVSVESSRASFSSSSRSSSFSSLDCNRATQLEPASFDRMIFPETPLMDPAMSQQNSSAQFSRKSLDLRDLVKDSIYKEVQGLSIKPKTTEEAAVPSSKYRDSPRLQAKSSDASFGSATNKKQSTSADVKESLRVLAKLQEAPRYQHEPRELFRSSSYHSKEGSSFSISKDAPRFSYDGREINRTRFDPHDGSNSTLKLKDLPRLSLDSREGSVRSLNADSKSNFFLKSMQKDSGVFDVDVHSQQQTAGNQARPPSVVAKLMGLETLPDSISSSETNMGSSRSYPDEEFVNNIFGSFEKTDPRKPIELSSSSKSSWKEPSSPRWRNSDGSMKPMPRSPIEPAPWKQIDGTRVSQRHASRSTRGPAKGATTFPSVYSEIEKRLNDLEFTQSGKDLRALKQILEAMQAKGLLETPKEGHGSNFTSHKDHEQRISSTRSVDDRKPEADQFLPSTRRKTVSPQNYDSPIVIMKPAKLVGRSGIPASSVISLDGISGLPKFRGGESVDNRKGLGSGRTSKDVIVKSNQRDNAPNSINIKSDRTLKTTQSSTRSQPLAKEGNAGWGKNTGSISPRMQQKKLELEKRSRPPTSPDSSKSKRLTNKQQAESNSPGGRRRPKTPNPQLSDDQMSEASVESRNLSNEDSAQSIEISADVISSEKSRGISSIQSSSTRPSEFKVGTFQYRLANLFCLFIC